MKLSVIVNFFINYFMKREEKVTRFVKLIDLGDERFDEA